MRSPATDRTDRRCDVASGGRLDRPARAADGVRLPDGWRPVFLLFVDTEEEFDWSRPPSRANTATSHVPALAEAQARFAAAGAHPTWLVDWPIAEDARARDVLGRAAADGAATVGLHLHPWVNPPFEEDVHAYNSFAGNLPPALEERKVLALRDRVADAFAVAPLVYRAGRYGVGPNTAAILERAGIRVDCSTRSTFSYRRQGGPDFSAHDGRPRWCGPSRRVLSLPLGVAETGLVGRRAPRWLRRAPNGPMRGLAARAGLFSRVPLTPEGTQVDEALSAIDRLVRERAPVLSFSFHSPSLVPGHTPYVRDAGDLSRFWNWWSAVFDRLAWTGVQPARVETVLAAAQGLSAANAVV